MIEDAEEIDEAEKDVVADAVEGEEGAGEEEEEAEEEGEEAEEEGEEAEAVAWPGWVSVSAQRE